MKSKLWIMIVLALACSLCLLATTACGDDDDDDDDDDNDDNDTGDDDTGDDDTGDDDDDDDDTSPPAFPDGYSVEPADASGEVGLSSPILVMSDATPMNRETFALRLFDGSTPVTGDGYFSRVKETFAGDVYYFFPDALLEENTEYTVELDIVGETYTTGFTTVADAGDIPIYANYDTVGTDLDPYAFKMTFPTVYEPGDLSNVLQVILLLWNYMAGPSYIASDDGETGELAFSVGAGENFDDDEFLEQNYTFTGQVFDGNIHGPYFKINGDLTIDFLNDPVYIDFFDVSIEFSEAKDGFSNVMGYASAYISDCSELTSLIPEAFHDLIDQVCDNNTLFISLEIALAYNPLDALTWDEPTLTSTDVEYSFDPGVWAEDGYLPSHTSTLIRVSSGGELVFDSNDYDDNFDYLWPVVDADGHLFNGLTFEFPETLSGTYDVDLFLGMYCYRMLGVTLP